MEKNHIDFWQMELHKLLDVLNSAQNIRLQLGIFFALTNLIGLALAFSFKASSLMLLTGSIMIIFMFADFLMVRTIYGYYYRAIRILNDNLNYSEESIFDMFMLFLRLDKIKLIHKIVEEKDNIKRYKLLRKLPIRHPTILGFWAPLLVFLTEAILSFYLYYMYYWTFF